jgi:hypothetical protein
MSRLAERNARKTGSVASGGRQSRPTEGVARAGGRVSTHTGRRHVDAAGTGSSYGMNAERHDWLVPLELP